MNCARSRVAAQQLDEAADVRVVERRLDLVEEIERARPREEEREQERDRAERLLAAGEEREPRHPLAGRAQLDLDARLAPRPPFQLGLGQAQAALAAREERRRHLLEVVARPRRTSPRSAARPSRSARREASRAPRGSPRGRRAGRGAPRAAPSRASYSSFASGLTLAERFAPALQPLELRDELLAVVALGRLGSGFAVRACCASRPPPPRAAPPRRRPPRRASEPPRAPAAARPPRRRAPQLVAELAAASRARVDASAQRRLECARRPRSAARGARSARELRTSARTRLERVRRVGEWEPPGAPALVQLGGERSIR